jgi:hypothetical protein
MDPQQQQAANMMAGMGAGVMIVVFLIFFVFLAFGIFLLWRIFTKAGMAGPLSLLVIVPFGPLIVLCILAFGEWKVVPAPVYGSLPPQYPPPPAYPTAS